MRIYRRAATRDEAAGARSLIETRAGGRLSEHWRTCDPLTGRIIIPTLPVGSRNATDSCISSNSSGMTDLSFKPRIFFVPARRTEGRYCQGTGLGAAADLKEAFFASVEAKTFDNRRRPPIPKKASEGAKASW
jgi:hypothetical protein